MNAVASKSIEEKEKPFDHQLVGRYDFLAEVVDEDVRALLLKARDYSRLSMAQVTVLDDGNLLICFEFGRFASAGKFMIPREEKG